MKVHLRTFFTVLLAGLYFSITLGVLACIKIFMDEMVGTHSGPNSSLNTRAISGQLELPEFTGTHNRV